MATERNEPIEEQRWRGLRERHLDLLVAEELAVNPQFTRWLAEGALAHLPDGERGPLPLPDGTPSAVRTTISYWDAAGHPEAAGETDVLVALEWQDRAVIGLFVEDKLDAVFQPWQAERYAARAAAAQVPTATVLVAPGDFIDRHAQAAGLFGKAVPIEEIAKWLRGEAATADTRLGPRLRWRADAFEIAASKRAPAPDDPRAVRFAELFAKAVESPTCVVNRMSCHTANQGWIWFKVPTRLSRQ